MKRNFKISEEESEAVVKGLEQGMGEHIKRQQISRRGFIKAMAGLGAMATTLTLPTGTPTLKEAVKLPWVGLPDKAGGGIGARKVEKIEDLYPVDTSVYKRFNYDEQMTEYPAYYQSKGLDYATYPTMTDNAKKNYEAGVSGFSQLDIAFHRASWTYNSLIRDHQTLRGVPGGPTYSSGSWVPLFPAQASHQYPAGQEIRV